MSGMVERVARAICEAERMNPDDALGGWIHWEEAARAAIEAMRGRVRPREIREQQKQFKTLCRAVIAHLAKMDVEMLRLSSPDSGARIARLCGDLELANDIALRFGLGLERRGVKLRKVSQ